MRKLMLGIAGTLALLLAGILAWHAEATTLTSAATIHTQTNHSLVEKAGCWLPGLPGTTSLATALLAQVGILGANISQRIRRFALLR